MDVIYWMVANDVDIKTTNITQNKNSFRRQI